MVEIRLKVMNTNENNMEILFHIKKDISVHSVLACWEIYVEMQNNLELFGSICLQKAKVCYVLRM